MKLFISYLRSKRLTLLSCLLFAAVFFAAFALYRLPMIAVLYPAAICLLLGVAALAIDYSRVRRHHLFLSELQTRMETVLDVLPEPHSVTERDYQALVRGLCSQAGAMQAGSDSRYRDMVEYYTVWAHQIKTPIAAMRLTLQNEDSPLSRQLSSDLFRIEQYVEMVLAFLRLDSDSSDYVFRSYALDDIIRRSVRKFASEFIGRKLRLEFTPTDYTAVTDEKWLAFVLEQLLSNALKYTREGSIRIAMDIPGILTLSDTGIGIAPEDLPRIFDKGYTGYNGRSETSASGIGLYLCRRVCKNLGVGISAASEIGVGTTIRLDLTQYPLRSE